MQDKPIKKLYYSIGEVSELTGLKQHVLRYWESEFPELKPAKNRAGNRIYRPKDVELVQLIKKLLYEEHYTIQGAREKIQSIHSGRGVEVISKRESPHPDALFLIEEIRRDLNEIEKLMNLDRGVAQSG